MTTKVAVQPTLVYAGVAPQFVREEFAALVYHMPSPRRRLGISGIEPDLKVWSSLPRCYVMRCRSCSQALCPVLATQSPTYHWLLPSDRRKMRRMSERHCVDKSTALHPLRTS